MIIAIFGASCSGKTATAERLAEETKFPVRHCGKRLREVATLIGLPLHGLPSSVHNETDTETVRFVTSVRTNAIVEGRYLDIVLAGVNVPITLIELTAEPAERLRRQAIRACSIEPPGTIGEFDRRDGELRASLYQGRERLQPEFTLDTTRLSIEQCANELLKIVKVKLPLLSSLTHN